MRSQGRGRGRWGEWWRGGVGSNPRRVMKFGLQKKLWIFLRGRWWEGVLGRAEGPGPCMVRFSDPFTAGAPSSVECEALPSSIADA